MSESRVIRSVYLSPEMDSIVRQYAFTESISSSEFLLKMVEIGIHSIKEKSIAQLLQDRLKMIKKEDAEMLLVNEINNALDNELSEEQVSAIVNRVIQKRRLGETL